MPNIGVPRAFETHDHPVSVEYLDPVAGAVQPELAAGAARRIAVVGAFDEVERRRTAPAVEKEKLISPHRNALLVQGSVKSAASGASVGYWTFRGTRFRDRDGAA